MTATSEPAGRPGESIETRRKRLTFRSWHRGWKEIDLLLGSFADLHMQSLDAAQLARYEALLEQPDPDVFSWITDQVAPPAEHDTDVMTMLKSHQYFARENWKA